MENILTDEEILANHLREMQMNRDRVARFYEKNKETIKQKRRERYAANKLLLTNAIERRPDLQPPTKKNKKSKKNPNAEYSLAEVLQIVKNDSTIKTSSKNAYYSAARVIFSQGGCQGIISCVKNKEQLSSLLIDAIDPKTGLPYKNNTLKSRFQFILLVLDRFFNSSFTKSEYELLHPYYSKFFNNYKLLSHMQTQANKEKFVPTFDEYKTKIISKFGLLSKENLVVSLFQVLTLRNNDYSKMIIIQNANEDDDDKNFVVVNGKKPITFILNEYKTNKKYKKFVFTLKPSDKNHAAVSALIHSWLDSQKKAPGDYFLNNGGSLSQFISKMTKAIDIELTPNLFRHIRAAELASELPGLTPQQRADRITELANEMQHSPATNTNYVRQLKAIKI